MRKLWPSLLLLLAVTVFGLLRFGDLPPMVASHWNAAGEPNGTSSRSLIVVMLPLIGLGLGVLLAFVPRLDPKRGNFPLHADAWWLLTNVIVAFTALLHLALIGNALGWGISVTMVIGVGIGALMMVLGNFLSRVRQNWFLGIRTPWTLSSERSWRQTHRLGGRLLLLGGLLVLVSSAITGTLPWWAIAIGVALPVLISVIYSYLVWSKDPEAEGRKA